jgi:uncharacterized protein YfaS (alpha-2-macroglobulin family)
VLDPKGNKVFRKSVPVDPFGVAAVDVPLADEILLGGWRVEAEIGETKSALDVSVSRYSLPKFLVKVSPSRPWYRPGDVVSGRIESRYFFGKPASGAKVKLSAGVFVDRFRTVAEAEGVADVDGVWGFEIALPHALPGLALQNGSAAIDLSVEVTDSTGQRVEKHAPLTVAVDALSMSVVPEGGTLVPGVENQLLVLVVRPDGEPVQKAVVNLIALGNPRGTTGEDGIAQIAFTPFLDRRDVVIRVEAPDGEIVQKSVELGSELRPGVIRTERTLYTAGETVKGEIAAISPAGVLFLDVVRDGTTIATHTVPLVGQKGTFAIDLPAESSGTVTLYAYLPGGGDLKRAQKTLFVGEPRSLSVSLALDRETYAPGKEAKLTLKVTGDDGKPATSSVSVAVVDESVFALAAKEPALLKAYFLLAEELSKPRYELDPARVVSGGASRDRAAQLLFSHPREAEVKGLCGTTARELHTRRAALVSKQSSTETVGFSLGLLLLGVLFEGALRFAFEKVFHALFANKWWRTGALVLGGGVALVAKVDGVHDFEAAVLGLGPLVVVLAVEGIVALFSLRFRDLATVGFLGLVVLVGFGALFGREIRALFATSATMLASASDHPRTIKSGKKNLAMFANTKGVSRASPAPALDFFGRAAERFEDEKAAAPPEPPKPSEGKADDAVFKEEKAQRKVAPATAAEKAQVRVRSWFPETMFWSPGVITGADGTATITVPVADSITRWRVSATASGADGRLGVGQSALRVFQDFFVDVELPPALTVGDEIELPIAVHNYLADSQTVKLEVEAANWFTALTPVVQELTLGPDEVKGVPLRLRATAFGKKTLTVYAFGAKLKDAVRREVEVRPDGVRVESAVGGPLAETVTATTRIPDGAIAGSERVLLRVYPGLFAAALEGLEGLLQMPGGCFEQTSSTTYPNVLVLDYLRRNKKSKPELEMRALSYIQLGYQRLLSFEVRGGGFEWFGRAPANQVLTAYGLLEFADMARVYEIDPAVIRRTQDFLVSRQGFDGGWEADAANLRDGLYRDDFAGRLGTTAYVAWALVESGYRGAATDRALAFLKHRAREAKGVYTRALIANALLAGGHDGSGAAEELLSGIEAAAVEERGKVRFPAGGQTAVYSRGLSADAESTSLAVLALSRAGRMAKVSGAMDWLLSSRDPQGSWGSTQATVLALRTLLSASAGGQDPKAHADLHVRVAGELAQTVTIRPETSDLVQTVDLTRFAHPGRPLAVQLASTGTARAQYQLATLAWVPRPRQDEALSLSMDYDRATLAPDDTITARVKATWRREGASGMVMLALGVPPGFEVDAGSVGALVASGKVGKFTLTGKELLLYVDRLPTRETVALSYRLKALFPVKVKAPSSVAYLYYQPEVRTESAPVDLVVRR